MLNATPRLLAPEFEFRTEGCEEFEEFFEFVSKAKEIRGARVKPEVNESHDRSLDRVERRRDAVLGGGAEAART